MPSMTILGFAFVNLFLTSQHQELDQDRTQQTAFWIRSFGDEAFTPANVRRSADSLAVLYPRKVFVLYAAPTIEGAAAVQCNCMSHSDFPTVKSRIDKIGLNAAIPSEAAHVFCLGGACLLRFRSSGRVQSTTWESGAKHESPFARLNLEGLEVLHIWPSFHRMPSKRVVGRSPHGPVTTMPLLGVDLFLRANKTMPDENRCRAIACSLKAMLSLSCPLSLLVRNDSWFTEPAFPLAYPFDPLATLPSEAAWQRRPTVSCTCK